MIPNVTRGGKTIGVLRYLVGRVSARSTSTRTWSPEPVRLAGDRELRGTDAGALARFLDEPRDQSGTQVTVAERNKQGQVVGTCGTARWHCTRTSPSCPMSGGVRSASGLSRR